MTFAFGVALGADVLVHFLYEINQVLIGFQCTVHIEHTTTNFPVDVVAIPFVSFQGITERLGKFGQRSLMALRFKLTVKAPIIPTSLLLSFSQTSGISMPTFFFGLLFYFLVNIGRRTSFTKIRKQSYFE